MSTTPSNPKSTVVTVQSREELFIELPEHLGFKPGQKFSVIEKENGIELKPFVEVTLELSDAQFIALAELAHARDISINDCVNEILTEMVAKPTEPTS